MLIVSVDDIVTTRKEMVLRRSYYVEGNGAKVAMLIASIDDIVTIRNDDREINALKSYLGKEFENKDLGELKYLELRSQGPRKSKKGIFISQCKFVLDWEWCNLGESHVWSIQMGPTMGCAP